MALNSRTTRSLSTTTTVALSALTAALVTIATPVPAVAGGTHTITIREFDEFDEGEAVGAAIEGYGKVTVGYAKQRGDIHAASVFSCLQDGDSAWVGTADSATVQRVTFDKKGFPTATELARLQGVVVTAMAKLPGGDLVAATLPGGTLVRIDRKGAVHDFAELKVQQIWALLPHEGRLLVATGPKGELYSLDMQGGDIKIILDVPEKNILSLLTVDGSILAGTSSKARLYRVSDTPSGHLLHAFKGDELRSMAVSGQNLIVAVNDFERRSVSSLQSVTKQLNRSSLTGTGPKNTSSAAQLPKASASLYRMDLGKKRDLERASEATWDRWLLKKKQYFTKVVAIDTHGTVLVSSSRAGKIYRVRGHRDVATVADLEERQATSLCVLKQGRILATAGDGAAIYRLQSGPASQATYTSEVFDLSQPAALGAVAVHGHGALHLTARSGPTDEPDTRWSAWNEVSLHPRRNALRGTITTPHHRYVQVKVGLEDRDSELRELSFYYAPENLAPRITEVNIDEPKFDLDDAEEPSHTSKVKWKADARDDDDLLYEVALRAEGEPGLGLPLSDEPTRKKEIVLDRSTVPDGVYEVTVTASDEPSNGSALARTDRLTSDPFTIDQTRPTITKARIEGSRVLGEAVDSRSRIHDVAYSIDGGPFRSASASDGLFDSSTERFQFILPDDLRRGGHRLVIRARDSHGNLVTTALAVRL